ncbi:STAS domain-containing protein [Streptomyces galbus]|uniref:STAS domain-containing protein n=1 Tax=Streptomyces galbus TaxID=33898 RepID=A0ABX1IIL3_STRGB|nr:STAS domain-containing protein [Streptomyces galbus]NKQ24246.1 STAS domain-containing protein [Streptomyces galbus]
MRAAAGARRAADGVPLVVEGRTDAGHALLTARGELVDGCASVLARELDALPPDTRRVEVDVSGVAFMDTAGLQFLEVLEAYGRRTALPVATRDWRGQPRRVLELAGLVDHSCTPDQAWSILRETSQLSNTKLRTVAEAVATSATGTLPPVEVRAALRTAIARHTG